MEYRQLLQLESDARRLRSEFSRDLLVRAAVSLDLAIRRAAWRAVAAVRAPRRAWIAPESGGE
jgi:hypothetical protein